MSSKEQHTADQQVLQEIEQEQLSEKETVSVQEADSRDERIAQLEAELTQAQAGVRDAQLRAQAEIANMRRRCEIDIEKAHKFALEKFASELLSVIDSLERAAEVADRQNPQLAAMIEGIDLTLKSLLDVVSKFGVNAVNEVHVPFNPDVHQAVTMIESEEEPNNHVLMVMQRGYTLNGRLLRPAMVTVSKKKS